MANTNNPFGLTPVERVSGAGYNLRKVSAPSTYATGLFVGALVTLTGTTNTTQITTGTMVYDVGTLPEVAQTAAGTGNPITGVVVGFDIDPNNLENIFGAASTERVLTIVDDPYALFEIQNDAILTPAQCGLNAVIIDTVAGSTITGKSGTQLDTGTTTAPAIDTAFQLTIMNFVPRTDNDPSTANSKVIVRINNHTNAHGAAGI